MHLLALCVEACPTEAITMTSLFEMSCKQNKQFDKDVLLVNEGELIHMRTNKLTNPEELKILMDMRTTSSSGDPDFQNTIGWTGSLGVGKKEPEKGQSLEEE